MVQPVKDLALSLQCLGLLLWVDHWPRNVHMPRTQHPHPPKIILNSALISVSSIGFVFVFLGPHMQHMEVPRLGIELELQLLAYTTATAMQDGNCVPHHSSPDPSHICDLHHSSWQSQKLNLLSKARDQTRMHPHGY